MTSGVVTLGPREATREILLLPPVRGRPADALAAGFDTALARVASPPRVTLVDLPQDDLGARTRIDALWPQHVEPAIDSGRRVWLAGISLGAWLAVLTTRRVAPPRAAQLAGLALIAPWLGTRAVHREIAAAGGPGAWVRSSRAPDADPPSGSLDEEREGWRYLLTTPLPVWLGYGTDDRFADAQSLLAATLKDDRIHRASGGHDWPCWVRIWEHLLTWLPC